MSQQTFILARRVHQLLIQRGATISVAESCTGGMLSHLLTLLPGSSSFFAAGIVVYSRSSKESVLGVSHKTLQSHGAVSADAAKEMAEKARALFRTELSIATTGNLGPEVLEGKQCGLIYVAVSGSFGTKVRELRLVGDRQENRETTSLKALELLLEAVKGKEA